MEDVKLTLVKADGMDDWYTIERAEHEGRSWLEPLGPGAAAVRYSGRISNADVEGSAEEMRAIAHGIRDRVSVSFKRCAIEFGEGPLGQGVRFYSPRNSTDEPDGGSVPIARAGELADEILTKLAVTT